MLPILQSLIDDALSDVCDASTAEWVRSTKACSVQVSPNRDRQGDFKTNCAVFIYKRNAGLTGSSVLTMNDGKASYEDVDSLARNIINKFDEENRKIHIARIDINDKGTIFFMTKLHLERSLLKGRLPCNICGKFQVGSRGLRMHYKSEHSLDQETATFQNKHIISASFATLQTIDNSIKYAKRNFNT